MKIREIYTVIREMESRKEELEEVRQQCLWTLDEKEEFLYDYGGNEQLSVQFQIDKGEGWVNFDP